MNRRWVIVSALLSMAHSVAFAQGPVITSFQGNGTLTWTNGVTNVMYRVEWSPTLASGWFRSWQSLTSMESQTNRTTSASVPMFYRVVMVTNPVPTDMVLVDAGQFRMGNQSLNESGEEWYSRETPVHPVWVDAFYMDRYEVCNLQWDAVHAWATNHGYEFAADVEEQGPHFPVASVLWYDAVKWCNARSEKEGLTPAYYASSNRTSVYRTGTNDIGADCVKWQANGYRLPTEAEWEKAARGGLDGHHFPWPSLGGVWSNHLDGTKANYLDSGDEYEWGGRTPVGYFNGSQVVTSSAGELLVGADMANGYGLYDMAGNAWEWCWDWFGWTYYLESPTRNPTGPTAGTARLIRGASMMDGGPQWLKGLRCSNRESCPPGYTDGTVGFRCARTAE